MPLQTLPGRPLANPAADLPPVPRPNFRRACATWCATAAALTMALCSVSTTASAAVNPLDAIIPDDSPVPTRGLLVWLPGNDRIYKKAGLTTSLKGSVAAGQIDGTPALNLSAGSIEVDTFALQADRAGLTIVLDYWHAKTATTVLWNPLFRVYRSAAFGQNKPLMWSALLKNGVPVIATGKSADGAPIAGASLVKGQGPEATPTSLNDGKPHQVALRLSRPGCVGGIPCPNPKRFLLSLLVDGTTTSEAWYSDTSLTDTESYLIEAGREDVGTNTYAQTNFSAPFLGQVGLVRQFMVYDRPLAVAELLALRTISDLGVIAQFPTVQQANGGEVRYSATLPASDLKVAPDLAPDANVLAEGSMSMSVAGTAAAVTTKISGWVRVPDGLSTAPTAPSPLVTVTFPGEARPVTLSAAMSAGSSARIFNCALGTSKIEAVNHTFVSKSQWVYVEIEVGVLGLACAVDGQSLRRPMIGGPATLYTGSGTVQVKLAPGVKTAYLTQQGLGIERLVEASAALLRDRLAYSPALWGSTEASALRVSGASTLSGGASGFSFWVPSHSALFNLWNVAAKDWLYKSAPGAESLLGAAEQDRQTVTFAVAMSSAMGQMGPWSSPKSIALVSRLVGLGFHSIQVDLVRDGFFSYKLVFSVGPRRFAITPTAMADKVRVTFTTPYKRTPSQLEEMGNPAETWQPDILIDGKALDPQSWTEAPSAVASDYTDPTKVSELGAKMGLAVWTLNSPLVEDFRVYPFIVGDARSLGLSHLASSCDPSAWVKDPPINCAASGRVCQLPAAPLTSPTCGGCRPDHYMIAGVPGSGAVDCRPKAAVGETCANDSMCLSGKCDADGTKRCIFAVQADCQTPCGAAGRVCGPKAGGFACLGCKPGFTPVDGAPITPASSPAPELLPDATCEWKPTKKSLEPCETNVSCESNECTYQTVDSSVELPIQFSLSKTAVTKTGGYMDGAGSDCGKNSASCWQASPKFTTTPSSATVLDKIKRCTPLVTPAQALAETPCRVAYQRSMRVSTQKQVTLPNGKSVTIGSCDFGPSVAGSNSCAPGLEPRQPILTWQACQAAIERVQLVYQTWPAGERACRTYKNWAGTCQAANSGPNPIWNLVPGAPFGSLVKDSANLSGADLVRLFLPGLSDYDRNSAITYDPLVHDSQLRAAGVGQVLIDFVNANQAERAKIVSEYGEVAPIALCAGHEKSIFKDAVSPQAPIISNTFNGAFSGDPADSAYFNGSNAFKCRPQMKENGFACPPPGATAAGFTANQYCLSNYCSRETKTCQDVRHPLQELKGDGQSKKKDGKSAVKFGIVRLDDTSVEFADSNAADASLSGTTNDYRFKATLKQSYVPCVLGKPLPSTPLLSARIDVDRTAGTVAGEPTCAKSESVVSVLGFNLDALLPHNGGSSVAQCTGVSYAAKQDPLAPTRNNGFTMCSTVQTGTCSFNPKALLSLPLSKFFPTAEVCVPTDELELPEVKKDFKEALVPLIISIGLELEMCIKGSFGLDNAKMPQISVTPGVAVGVVARGGVGSGETGVYEVSAGVQLALTLVSIAFPVTWGVEADAAITSTVGEVIKGYFKIALVQRIVMELEYLGGRFGLYAKFALGPFGVSWTFDIFKWEGIKMAIELGRAELFSAIIDFVVPKKVPPGPAAATCADTNVCYQ